MQHGVISEIIVAYPEVNRKERTNFKNQTISFGHAIRKMSSVVTKRFHRETIVKS